MLILRLKILNRAILLISSAAFLIGCSTIDIQKMERMPYTPPEGKADANNGRTLFRDKTLGGSVNKKSCRSCHKRESELAGSASKNYDSLFGFITRDVEEVINLCIVLPLKGKPYFKQSKEMQDLIAYLKTL